MSTHNNIILTNDGTKIKININNIVQHVHLTVSIINTCSVKSSSETIQQQLCAQNDLILIQESWLYPDELSYVSNLCEEFSSFSLPSMPTENKLIRGRPHGGISMWRKTLSHGVKVIRYDDERILGIELKTSHFIILILCIYMPYECNEFFDDFCFYLDKVKCISLLTHPAFLELLISMQILNLVPVLGQN